VERPLSRAVVFLESRDVVSEELAAGVLPGGLRGVGEYRALPGGARRGPRSAERSRNAAAPGKQPLFHDHFVSGPREFP